MAVANAPIHAQIAAARAIYAELNERHERRTLARYPIDHDLEAEINEAEMDLLHLETLLAQGCSSRYDQVPYEPRDLDVRRPLRMAA